MKINGDFFFRDGLIIFIRSRTILFAKQWRKTNHNKQTNALHTSRIGQIVFVHQMFFQRQLFGFFWTGKIRHIKTWINKRKFVFERKFECLLFTSSWCHICHDVSMDKLLRNRELIFHSLECVELRKVNRRNEWWFSKVKKTNWRKKEEDGFFIGPFKQPIRECVAKSCHKWLMECYCTFQVTYGATTKISIGI